MTFFRHCATDATDPPVFLAWPLPRSVSHAGTFWVVRPHGREVYSAGVSHREQKSESEIRGWTRRESLERIAVLSWGETANPLEIVV
jgi:hypothetical protein